MRKEKEIVISAGRDKGKKFKIKEMGALSAEKWATRALVAIVNSGVEVPEETAEGQGMAGLAKLIKIAMKSLSSVKYELLEPLYDELLMCCSFCNGISEETLNNQNAEAIIEEVSTLLVLRKEALEIHLGFLTEGESLTSPLNKENVAPKR